ncbi:MAG: tRNA lysidine(34) synthetase TilS, partial [Oscillospiraceae bacterium]|nr:tRNA lysidine(34) synthetase TilS [Oscillospiraceae bacterium]
MCLNIRSVIEKYNMLSGGETVIIALSGGADSVCLLHALLELNITVEACHVNHKLRGEASDSDEMFVRNLCERLGIKLHVYEINVKSLQKKHQSLEECAREARYSYFAEIGAGKIIATAHTAGDNTETVLLNLIRGTGLRGLCGIPPKRDNIIRPLIETTRAEILTYLEKKGADFVTDESNFSDEFTRNNLRLNVIPLLEKINPSFNAGVMRMCESLRLDEEYLHKIAVSSIEQCDEGAAPYRVDLFLNQPSAIQNRIISLLL